MGSPDDFRYFVDHLHANGIGVILDWVPAHFATDRVGARALRRHRALRARRPAPRPASRLGHATSSTSAAPRCSNFLLANALFWLREYHVDGLRVDAVASMLYLDYSREAGRVGAEPLRRARGSRGGCVPAGAQRAGARASSRASITVAEESTAWPGVSRPTYVGGLGFGFKWNMGWMHDTLELLRARADPPPLPPPRADVLAASTRATRTSSCRCRTTRSCTASARCSSKMPGDRWQQLANLRALYAYMWAHPGKKLLFMGGELATPWEWSDQGELPWSLLEHARARRHARPGARPERDLPRGAGALGGRLLAATASAGSSRTTRWRTCSRSCALARRRSASSSASRTSRRCRASGYRVGAAARRRLDRGC